MRFFEDEFRAQMTGDGPIPIGAFIGPRASRRGAQIVGDTPTAKVRSSFVFDIAPGWRGQCGAQRPLIGWKRMPDEITITIDGREVTTSPGKMVIEAANEAGIYVPYLCYHPGMKPYGACRMCVVEVEGARGVPASCTLPVREGMTVNTKPQAATEVRDTTLDLLLSEHPHGCLTCHRVDLCGPQDICLRHVDVLDRCVTCPKNERCELKDTTRFHTRALASPLHFQYRELKVDTQDPFYDRDYNLCIVCARCVRACDELRGDVALTMTEKAGQVLVGTVMGESLLESGCEFCGTCIDVCPVGALTETKYKWERPARTEQSVCGECPVGCTMTYEVNRWEKVIRAVPELNSPVNRGLACFKGKFGYDYVNDKRRLRQPLVRRDGALREATWEEAVRAAADGLAPHQGEAFALMASPRNTNEELYVAQKFARVAMGSNNVDVASNDRPGVVEGLQDVLGCFAGTMSLDDVRGASVVVAVNANLTEEQNVIGAYVKQAVREGTQQLIVIDHREVEADPLCEPLAPSLSRLRRRGPRRSAEGGDRRGTDRRRLCGRALRELERDGCIAQAVRAVGGHG